MRLIIQDEHPTARLLAALEGLRNTHRFTSIETFETNGYVASVFYAVEFENDPLPPTFPREHLGVTPLRWAIYDPAKDLVIGQESWGVFKGTAYAWSSLVDGRFLNRFNELLADQIDPLSPEGLAALQTVYETGLINKLFSFEELLPGVRAELSLIGRMGLFGRTPPAWAHTYLRVARRSSFG